MAFLSAAFAGVLLLSAVKSATAQWDDESSASSSGGDSRSSQPALTKTMRLAIDLYQKGRDLEAMDRFMEILVKGDPTERPLANRYLNRITKRMAIGTRMPEKDPEGPTVIEDGPARAGEGYSEDAPSRGGTPPARIVGETPERPVRGESLDSPLPPAPIQAEDRPERSPRNLSRADKRLMKTEIEGKIKSRTRVLLGRLRKYEDLTVRMANSRLPRAVGIPPKLLFSEGTKFNSDAGKVLEIFTDLVFSLGATQIVILPEGAILNDAKIIDMRRTMAISSHLVRSGVAPPRVQVNLLSNQVDIPRDLNNFKGILVLFVYNQPLTLSSEDDTGGKAGPPISLGISPPEIDPKEGEGTIIEFSVVEPPAGLMSWRFQLLGPAEKAGDDLIPLQEVKGSAPVFHQIYWNGRRKYFGSVLAAGRYECVLTATDMRNRSQKKRVWISVKGAPPPAPPPPAAKTASSEPPSLRAKGPPPASLAPRKSSTRRRSRRRPRRRSSSSRSRKSATGPAGTAPAAAAQPAPKAAAVQVGGSAAPRKAPTETSQARAGAVNYQVFFSRNTSNITRDGENILTRVAETMHYYPLDNINLVGYAYEGEGDAVKLSERRADLVSRLLVERHGMKPSRIKVKAKVVDYEATKVEIYIVAGGA